MVPTILQHSFFLTILPLIACSLEAGVHDKHDTVTIMFDVAPMPEAIVK